jgi:hemerythrin-like domain-containing protein
MQDLINEHKEARQHVKILRESGDEYFGGDTSKIQDIKKAMVWIVNFYPVHIKKEDDIFFPRTEKMFSPEELDAMLEEFYEFDRKMIHEKYKKLVESLL